LSEEFKNRVLSTLKKNMSESSEGVIITIRVDEGSEESLFIETDELVFKTPIKPGTGRENAALISFLARTLKIPSSRIDVVYGARERIKRLLISGVNVEELALRLLRVVRLI